MCQLRVSYWNKRVCHWNKRIIYCYCEKFTVIISGIVKITDSFSIPISIPISNDYSDDSDDSIPISNNYSDDYDPFSRQASFYISYLVNINQNSFEYSLYKLYIIIEFRVKKSLHRITVVTVIMYYFYCICSVLWLYLFDVSLLSKDSNVSNVSSDKSIRLGVYLIDCIYIEFTLYVLLYLHIIVVLFTLNLQRDILYGLLGFTRFLSKDSNVTNVSYRTKDVSDWSYSE